MLAFSPDAKKGMPSPPALEHAFRRIPFGRQRVSAGNLLWTVHFPNSRQGSFIGGLKAALLPGGELKRRKFKQTGAIFTGYHNVLGCSGVRRMARQPPDQTPILRTSVKWWAGLQACKHACKLSVVWPENQGGPWGRGVQRVICFGIPPGGVPGEGRRFVKKRNPPDNGGVLGSFVTAMRLRSIAFVLFVQCGDSGGYAFKCPGGHPNTKEQIVGRFVSFQGVRVIADRAVAAGGR